MRLSVSGRRDLFHDRTGNPCLRGRIHAPPDSRRAPSHALEQAREVVVHCKGKDDEHQAEARLADPVLRPFGKVPAAQALEAKHHELSAVEHRHGDQVHEADRDRDERKIFKEGHEATANGVARHVGNADRARQVLRAGLARGHLANASGLKGGDAFHLAPTRGDCVNRREPHDDHLGKRPDADADNRAALGRHGHDLHHALGLGRPDVRKRQPHGRARGRRAYGLNRLLDRAHPCAVDGQNPVAARKPRLFGGRILHRSRHDGVPEPGHEAEMDDGRAPAHVVKAHACEREMPDEGLITAGEPDGNVGAARQTEKLDVHVRDAENRRTVDGQHAVALPHVLARRLRACGRRAHDGREVGRSDRADHHVEKKGEDEVRSRTRKEHEAALPAGLTGVEPAAVLFSEIRIRLVGHPHVAAKRQGREAVFGLPLSPSPEHRAHAEGESRHLDVEELGREEMAALVNDDDDADGE